MRLLLSPLLLLGALILFGCGSDTSGPDIRASLLIETPEESQWIRDLVLPKGTDGYELLDTAVNGELEANWFPQYRSHFVTSIRGEASSGAFFWLTFVWDESTMAWQPLPVGADLYSIKDGHILAWALIDTSLGEGQVPNARP